VTSADAGAVITVAGLLLVAGFFSAAEIAVLSVARFRLDQLAQAGRKSARLLELLLERPQFLLTTILVAITAANYGAETVAVEWAHGRNFGPWGVPVVTAAMIVIVLILAEVVPISYAAANAERVALSSARPLRWATMVLWPVARLISWLSMGLVRVLGLPATIRAAAMTEDQLKAIVSLETERGVLEEEEREMIHSIFRFGDQVVREVMVPRPDMVCAERGTTVGRVVELALEHHVSRLPVYQEQIDLQVGIVHIKQLFPLIQEGRIDAPVELVMRPPYLVPETKRISELLREFRDRKESLAVVVDEHGSTVGLVTVEDLLEEIVGDIFDEYDVPEPLVSALGPNEWLVDGKLPIDEAGELIGTPLPQGDFDTIAGLIYDRLGSVGVEGDRVEVNGIILTIERTEGLRITQVRVLRVAPPAAEGEPA
jgi:CBS domain containing-hemolysin-like protein